MKISMLLATLILGNMLYAQQGKLLHTIQEIIPAGWKQLSVVKGDLNNDKHDDIVLVLQNNDTANYVPNTSFGNNTLNVNPRRLLIFFKENNDYRLRLSTDMFLPTQDDSVSTCLEDPLAEGGIAIKNGILQIGLHYWLSCGSWFVTNYTYSFRYQHNKFELIGVDVYSLHRASGETSTISINYSTNKKQIITGGNEFEEANNKPVEKWEKIKAKPLYNLAEMTDQTVIDEIQL